MSMLCRHRKIELQGGIQKASRKGRPPILSAEGVEKLKDLVTTNTVDMTFSGFAAQMQELQRQELGNDYVVPRYSRQTVYSYRNKVAANRLDKADATTADHNQSQQEGSS